MGWTDRGPGRKDKWPNNFPPGFLITYLSEEGTLNQPFEAGKLDTLVCARTPKCYRDGKTSVRRMFENFEKVEKAYYRKSGPLQVMYQPATRPIQIRLAWREDLALTVAT